MTPKLLQSYVIFRIYYTFQIEGIFFFSEGTFKFYVKNSQSGTIAIFTISSKCPEGRDVGTVSRVMFNLRFVTQYEQTAATLDILYSLGILKTIGCQSNKHIKPGSLTL